MRPSLRMLAAIALSCATVVSAQPDSVGWGRRSLPYDGRFTFVRLRWRAGTHAVRPDQPGVNFWLHEYPRAEQNLISVLNYVTRVRPQKDGSLILTLDDPALFKYPVAMLWEPGYWTMTDREAVLLRTYLLKGGFLIVNDFELDQWDNFEAQMRRVMPSAKWIPLNATHAIFNSFFRIAEIDPPHHRNHHLYGLRPKYFGLFEDNDPRKRLLAIANYNTNLAEYWQMAGTGFFPVDPSNDAFKLGVNYMMYALTH